MLVHLTRVDLIVVGSLSKDYARIVEDYERRLTRYVKLHVHEVKALPVERGEAQVIAAESERISAIIAKVSGGTKPTICALDSRGEQLTTEQLAQRWLDANHLVLLIGGTLGLSDELRSRADLRVSFGRVTLPHQLARVVTTEQLYRSFRIARGEPYHF